MNETQDLMTMDKTAFSVASLSDDSDEVDYWLTKSPQERLRGVELMRQVVYDYQPSSARLQRVLTVAKLSSD
ncbi:MAG TPA: hypothetical protein VM943_02375 [Pyrinomonadaceae bacterium]|nr:hypothetical protein [Pyrinomonadaceae bacterium]